MQSRNRFLNQGSCKRNTVKELSLCDDLILHKQVEVRFNVIHINKIKSINLGASITTLHEASLMTVD